MIELPLPDPRLLDRIEDEFWTAGGRLPTETRVLVRGSPAEAEKLLAHADRQAREFSLRGENMASISVDLLLDDWPIQRVLEVRMVTRSRYSTCLVGDIEAAGFEVLATIARPHADVVFPELSILWAERLAGLLLPVEVPNPYKRRR